MDPVQVTADLFDELAGRPDIEAVDARYRELLAAIRDTLVVEFGIPPWIPPDNPVNTSIGRGPYARLGGDGEIRRYSSGRSPGAVSDADWPRAAAMVAELAAQHGFGEPTVVVDRPGDHEVSLAGEHGGELLFGTAANTTLSLTTGCHLTREAYLRGPSRPPTPASGRGGGQAGESTRESTGGSATEPAPPPSAPPPPRPAPPVVEKDFDQVDFVTATEPQRTPEPRPVPLPAATPPEPPRAAPTPPEPPKRRRRTEVEEDDFDMLEFVRKKK